MSYKHSSHGYHSFFKETLFAQVVLVLIFLLAIWFFKWSIDKEQSISDQSNSNMATLIINFNNAERSFEGEVTSDMTLLDALSASAAAGEIHLDYEMSQSGDVELSQIDGHVASDWEFVFSLNKESIPAQDLNRKVVNPGDVIEVEFQPL